MLKESPNLACGSPGRGLYGAPGFMPPSLRIAWRDRYGDLPALLDAADSERDAGRLANAWVGYTLAMQQWIRRAWEEYSGDVDENPRSVNSYAQSFYRAKAFDKWTVRVIEKMTERPKRIHWWHVDALGSFVRAMALESSRVQREGGEPCSAHHA